MLDRKTKNIDASIELLEDRMNDDKNWCLFSLIFGTIALLIGFVLSLLDDLSSIIVCLYGLALLVLGGVLRLKTMGLSLLIQSKKIMKTLDVHAIFLDEIEDLVLNNIDGLEKKVNEKAGKKK